MPPLGAHSDSENHPRGPRKAPESGGRIPALLARFCLPPLRPAPLPARHHPHTPDRYLPQFPRTMPPVVLLAKYRKFQGSIHGSHLPQPQSHQHSASPIGLAQNGPLPRPFRKYRPPQLWASNLVRPTTSATATITLSPHQTAGRRL